jgi:hypothetical protein
MSDHDEQCELRRAIDAIPVDCRCEVRRLNARLAAGIAATNDKSEAYGLYAIGWNAALKHVRDVLENNDA